MNRLCTVLCTALLALSFDAETGHAQTQDDLVLVLSELLGQPATRPATAARTEATVELLLLQTAARCRDRLESRWTGNRELGGGWTIAGAATDAARQTRVYTVADPSGALWTVAVVAADQCLLELSGSGHRSVDDVWRFALPPLQPTDADPVELPW